MSFIDRSPGGFILVANVVLYSTVLAETGMLMSGSILVMWAVMVLIAGLAAFLCRFIMNLMGPESYILGEEPAAAAGAAAAEVAPSTQPRTPARGHGARRRRGVPQRPAPDRAAGPLRA